MANVVASNLIAPFGIATSVRVAPLQSTLAGTILPTLFASALAGGVVGTAYNEVLTVDGGTSPYAFSLASGALPAGLALSSSTGIIAGMPTTTGLSAFAVTVTDAAGLSSTQSFTLIVAAPSSGGNYGWIG